MLFWIVALLMLAGAVLSVLIPLARRAQQEFEIGRVVNHTGRAQRLWELNQVILQRRGVTGFWLYDVDEVGTVRPRIVQGRV